MLNILNLLPKPSHYIGIEEGAIHKRPEEIHLRMVLAFPDMYEVGMSYLGQKILYGLVNEHEGWAAERVFTPCIQGGAVLKANNAPLCSLESDTPLADFDVIGFSITHELCYTNILYMLDLAGLPFYSSQRVDEACSSYPLIVAGGGCTMAAEAVAPFFDIMFLGDGEELLPDFLQLLEKAKAAKLHKSQILTEAAKIPGLYVPQFFAGTDARTSPKPLQSDYTSVARRAVKSLDKAYYPLRQTLPFGAVHNRLALEIARGCTRGCRFCQAGMLYRPVRERSLATLENLMEKCLNSTGYDDISYLALSTGDFSALKTFFASTIEHCAREQISVSLPSLRIGSIDDVIMEGMAGIRRTGVTLAPEAGSQRLRNVINKGITEEEIILHTQKLFEHGWQQIKLYFMLGLPTETDEDLYAIIDLCRKVRDAAGSGIKRLQVTASVSIFVPKPHTPFQWVDQISLEEMERRINLLLTAAKTEKRIKMRWHRPEMSFLEGVFSRSDRRLAPVIESAYRKGALFTAWIDQFQLAPWLEAMQEHKLDPKEFTTGFALDSPLPWDHLDSGINKEFLLREYSSGLAGELTPDCRYTSCQGCGICTDGFANILNFKERDQTAHKPRLDEYGRVITREQQINSTADFSGKNLPPALSAALVAKVNHYRIWYSKKNQAIFISQLEMQSIFERAMRRGNLPLTFSQGFKPVPLVSFSRALPVGVASNCEWFSLYLREAKSQEEVWTSFKGLPTGLTITSVGKLPLGQRPEEAISETYMVQWVGSRQRENLFTEAIQIFSTCSCLPWIKKGKKHDKEMDIKTVIPVVRKAKENQQENKICYEFVFDWSTYYTSPLSLSLAALGLALPDKNENIFSAHELLLTKIAQD